MMTGSVEAAETGADKPAGTGEDAEAGGAAPASAAAVDAAGARRTPASVAAALSRRLPSLRVDPRMAAVATLALAVGTGLGMLSAPREPTREVLTRIETGVAAGRADAARLGAEVEQLARTLSAMRETNETVRSETRIFGAGLTERLTRMEQGLDRRIAALIEKPVPAEREAPASSSAAPLAATPSQGEKHAATPAAASTTAAAVPTARAEPSQTGSLAEPRQKPETVEAWALRDVYDGVAMLEDRRRRLVEVAPGDAVPGAGRVEAIERRGRNWVVVTRQGLITPQTW